MSHQSEEAKKKGGEFKPGMDSELYLVEERLIELGYERHPWETLFDWLKRIEEAHLCPVSTEPLASVLALHYRSRFDPIGIRSDEKAALRSKALSWLARLNKNLKS